jgi:hypothetical protein
MTADQATIFQGDQPQTSATPDGQTGTTPPATQTSDIVSALVGEGKKYKTFDDLAKGYINADGFIEQLKAENRDLKEKVTAAKTVDDVLQRLNQQQTTQESDPSPAPTKGVDVSELSKLVEATVTGLETQKQRRSNMLKADAKMKEVFGEKAGEKFAEFASTPELQKVYTELASVDPDKFISLFVGDVPKNTGVGSGGTVNTTVNYSSANPSGRVQQFGTKEYFDNIRRTNPKSYYSTDFQLKMDTAVRTNPNLYYKK